MRTAVLILLVIHGLIHLLGFAKAFGFLKVEEISQPISKPFGVVWLGSFLLFTVVALFFAFRIDYWWLFGLSAVLLSQMLIIFFWKDAKFGSIANILILITILMGW